MAWASADLPSVLIRSDFEGARLGSVDFPIEHRAGERHVAGPGTDATLELSRKRPDLSHS